MGSPGYGSGRSAFGPVEKLRARQDGGPRFPNPRVKVAGLSRRAVEIEGRRQIAVGHRSAKRPPCNRGKNLRGTWELFGATARAAYKNPLAARRVADASWTERAHDFETGHFRDPILTNTWPE